MRVVRSASDEKELQQCQVSAGDVLCQCPMRLPERTLWIKPGKHGPQAPRAVGSAGCECYRPLLFYHPCVGHTRPPSRRTRDCRFFSFCLSQERDAYLETRCLRSLRQCWGEGQGGAAGRCTGRCLMRGQVGRRREVLRGAGGAAGKMQTSAVLWWEG
jgi:hypothetical protein